MNILAICGSLRAVSSNKSLLGAAARLAPEGVIVSIMAGRVVEDGSIAVSLLGKDMSEDAR